jgi:RNA polymerase sigma factor (sigma-70 family)
LADEVAHEIAQESWRSIQSHDPERSTWRTYFEAIARNVLRAKYRKLSREQPVDFASVGELLGEADGLAASQLEAAPDHESQAMADEATGLLMRVVAELDENERSALILVRVKGLTFAQAAEQLGLPAGRFNHTLRNATTKARAALARLLRDDEP